MNSKSILLAAVLAVALVIAGFFANRSAESAGAAPETAGEAMLPELYDQLNDVAKITVRTTEGELNFEQQGDDWVFVERDGYPIQPDNVRAALIAMAELKLVEAKTTNASKFEQLGVQPVGGAPTAEHQSKEITLQSAGGETLAALLIGKPRSGGSGRTFYARQSSSSQSWLVEGKQPSLPNTGDEWLDKEVVEINRTDVMAARITHADGEVLTVSKATPDANFKPHEIPEGRELSYDAVAGTVAGAMQFVNFDDVEKAEAFEEPGAPDSVTEVWTNDGMRVTVELWEKDGAPFARFAAAYDLDGAPKQTPLGPVPADGELAPGEARVEIPPRPREVVEAEVEALNARVSNWVYKLPTYTKSNLAKRLDSLLKPLPEPVEEEAGPSPDDDSPIDIDSLGGAPPVAGDDSSDG